MGKARKPFTGQVPSWIIEPPYCVGAWLTSGKDKSIAKVIKKAEYGRYDHTKGEIASKNNDSSQNARAGQHEVDCGEGQASRILTPSSSSPAHTDYTLRTWLTFPILTSIWSRLLVIQRPQ